MLKCVFFAIVVAWNMDFPMTTWQPCSLLCSPGLPGWRLDLMVEPGSPQSSSPWLRDNIQGTPWIWSGSHHLARVCRQHRRPHTSARWQHFLHQTLFKFNFKFKNTFFSQKKISRRSQWRCTAPQWHGLSVIWLDGKVMVLCDKSIQLHISRVFQSKINSKVQIQILN